MEGIYVSYPVWGVILPFAFLQLTIVRRHIQSLAWCSPGLLLMWSSRIIKLYHYYVIFGDILDDSTVCCWSVDGVSENEMLCPMRTVQCSLCLHCMPHLVSLHCLYFFFYVIIKIYKSFITYIP